MNTPKLYIKTYFQDLLLFLKSTDFSKAFILGMAITIPITVGVYYNYFEVGLALALGALLSSPSDVTGSFRHKKIGVLLSALLACSASILGGYLAFDTWIFLPILGVVMFAISYLSVYGFRASLISFSGLFAMVLSMANISNVLEIHERALLIGLGGVWYLLLAILLQKLNPRGQTEQFLAYTLDLTSKYLHTRGQLLEPSSNREVLQKRLLDIQSDLNEKHETLRDILISSRKASGNSNYERKRLLIFIQLVDILELAMANPVDYSTMDTLLKNNPNQIKAFQELIFGMSQRLEKISEVILTNSNLASNNRLENYLSAAKESLNNYKKLPGTYSSEAYLMLQNIYDYQEQQVQKINKIEGLLSSKDIGNLRLLKNHEAIRFINPQEYDLKILIENFSFKSSIFKHSLRLAVVVMLGYALGAYFSVQNAYWILLTIIVIMRPNYGLTKTRSKQRMYGTLIGAAIATGIVLLTHNLIIYGVLAILSLVLAFSMVQKNYKTSATFITLSVVFVYALLKPNVFNVIQFRVLDTLIGAGLATLGNLVLWPSWEFLSIRTVIGDCIKSNASYLQEIIQFYDKKGQVPTSYKIARKEAFLSTGNLSSAFQRMTQEPKSKQKELDNIYELVVLNHSFLSSLASMGTYIQNHPTTEASTHFRTFAHTIDQNLKKAIASLEDNRLLEVQVESNEMQEAASFFDNKYRELINFSESNQQKIKDNQEVNAELQEAQLIIEQLRWLFSLSQKMIKRIKQIDFN
ncbi:FUSC family protein [Gillisia sp. M10.2A]|uniref:FUSC family protein n=1 Tax=Gillisia lutea TaxID=2909668 RepID=A0ABS9EFU4_9FLAO|nr:FUSC family membrane protein [Gillisia lutea]MCF4101668.1 FUSC family protein [Gillisia lutea]